MQRAILLLIVIFIECGAGGMARAQAPAAPLGSPALDVRAPQTATARPQGAPANQWRYQFYSGRWWYWLPDSRWSYYDGSRWRTYSAPRTIARQPVDPAQLRLEAKEGVLGARRWPHVGGAAGGGGSFSISGTQGSIGGAPSGPFTTSPSGLPGSINTNPIPAIGLSPETGFGGARARSGDAGSGVGGGAVGGTTVTGGANTGAAR